MERQINKPFGYRRFNQQHRKDKGDEPQGLQNMEGKNKSSCAFSGITNP